MPIDTPDSPQALAVAFLAFHDYRRGRTARPLHTYNALGVWEEWIVDAPERAWPVFLELVRLRPADDELLEAVWYRLGVLLFHHWDAWHERAQALVAGNPRLARIAPAAELRREFYEPRYETLEQLAAHWLDNQAVAERAHELDRLIEEDGDAATRLVLELVRRGPLHGFTSRDFMNPVMDLLRVRGWTAITAIEDAAQHDTGLRRVLWRMQRQHDEDTPGTVEAPIWSRAVAAAGNTTDYNSDAPAGSTTPLPPELEAIAEAWFAHEASFWAWQEVWDIVDTDADAGWQLVQHLVDAAPDALLGHVAAGPLEDLLSRHAPAVYERVVVKAALDERFRDCLGGVWLSYEDVPEPIAKALYVASGEQLQILEDADEPWREREADEDTFQV